MESLSQIKLFYGRKIVIGTKHQKERVISPILLMELGLESSVLVDLDTDVLGTFSGEIERKDNPLVTVRKKCELALDISGADLAIANEGSFGPHPASVFLPAGDEIIMLYDRKNNVEFVERELNTDTNFHGSVIKTEKQLQEFSRAVKFPTHAIILRKAKDDHSFVVKGINTVSNLNNTYNHLIQKYGCAYAETDMRAMYNPTRMNNIEKATIKLVNKIKSLCPHCNFPGFAITEVKPGLLCGLCGLPTRSIKSHLYICQNCCYQKELMYPSHNQKEDPMYCDYCNP